MRFIMVFNPPCLAIVSFFVLFITALYSTKHEHKNKKKVTNLKGTIPCLSPSIFYVFSPK